MALAVVLQRTVPLIVPEQATISGGLSVRTGVKAGLLTALLLQQPPPEGAAGGDAIIPSP